MPDKQLTADAFGGVNPIEAVLFLNDRHTLLPELFDIFGSEETLHFLEVFGGKTFTVPSLSDVQRSLEHVAIWAAVSKNDSPLEIRRLARRYSIPVSEVKAAHRRVQDMFNEQEKRFFKAKPSSTTRDTEIGALEGGIEAEERNEEEIEFVSLDDLYGNDDDGSGTDDPED